MSACRLLCASFLAMWLVGCATINSTLTVAEPEQPVTDDGTIEEPDENGSDEPTSQIRMDFSYPDGWEQSFDAEQNQTVLRHSSGATIYFTIWPLEQFTPFLKIYEAWETMVDDSDQGAPIQPGQPTTRTDNGVESTYVISILTVEGGQRITLIHAAFPSNDDRFGILVSGIWPQSNNTEMLLTFRHVAQSIRIVSE